MVFQAPLHCWLIAQVSLAFAPRLSRMESGIFVAWDSRMAAWRQCWVRIATGLEVLGPRSFFHSTSDDRRPWNNNIEAWLLNDGSEFANQPLAFSAGAESI